VSEDDEVSWILPGILAQGSRPTTPKPFHVVVLCAHGWQPLRIGKRSILHAPLGDRYDPDAKQFLPLPSAELGLACRTGRRVAKDVMAGKRVLVTCEMGWNRSGLVTGIALLELGRMAPEAIRMIRAARGPRALGNTEFVRILHAYDEQLRRVA
jgi:protein-tyrosine phosphatase